MHAQVAIVLFRTLVEFYDTPLGLGTLPLMMWRFAIIGIGSIMTGKAPLQCLHTLAPDAASLEAVTWAQHCRVKRFPPASASQLGVMGS